MFKILLRLAIAIAVLAVLLAYFLSNPSHFGFGTTQTGEQSESHDTVDSGSGDVNWSSTGSESADENARHHWQKHGREFNDLHSEKDYEEAARDFVDHPPPGTEEKHRANGDTLYYNRQTNTFAVQRKDGAPRTMFKPDSGESYWDRQQ